MGKKRITTLKKNPIIIWKSQIKLKHRKELELGMTPKFEFRQTGPFYYLYFLDKDTQVMSVISGDTLDTKPSHVNVSWMFSLQYSPAERSPDEEVLETERSRFYFHPRETTRDDFSTYEFWSPWAPGLDYISHQPVLGTTGTDVWPSAVGRGAVGNQSADWRALRGLNGWGPRPSAHLRPRRPGVRYAVGRQPIAAAAPSSSSGGGGLRWRGGGGCRGGGRSAVGPVAGPSDPTAVRRAVQPPEHGRGGSGRGLGQLQEHERELHAGGAPGGRRPAAFRA